MSGSPLPSSDRSRTVAGNRHRLSRYDVLLAVVPAAFLVGLLAAGLTQVPLRVAMASAATVGALALFDGLFLNPPRPRAREGRGQ